MTNKRDNGSQGTVIRIYIDSNIVLDVIDGRRSSSVALLDMIKRKKWECITSYFTYMEVLDSKQENKFVRMRVENDWEIRDILRRRTERNLTTDELLSVEKKIDNRFFIAYKHVLEYAFLTDEGWDLAIGISAKSNINAPDAIHLATAIDEECDILVSNDQFFIKTSVDYLDRIRNKRLHLINSEQAIPLIEEKYITNK